MTMPQFTEPEISSGQEVPEIDPDIFAKINFDEGTDNPWQLTDGVHDVTISNAQITYSKSGNLGMWLTFQNDKGQQIRRWTAFPEDGQDPNTRSKNISYMRMLFRQLEIPENKWNKLEPNDFIGIECIIIVKPQSMKPGQTEQYYQVVKITRKKAPAPGGGLNLAALNEFKKDEPAF